MRAFLIAYCALFGLVVGSFLNVVIYRVPRDESIVTPRSSCPSCGAQIRENGPPQLIDSTVIGSGFPQRTDPGALVIGATGVAFDEKWYLTRYPDVASAVTTGIFKSGRQHFIEVGYFEGRRPREFEVDEKWYLETYPDVAEGLGKGVIKSARQHFNEHGYDEGRFPAEP